jgi:hypothetical protein
MNPIAAITDITARDIDTVIIWNDGQRPIAYAYQAGRVIRTTPLDARTLPEQVNEIRAAFRIADGQVTSIIGTPAPAPAYNAPQPLATGGPSRWG